VRLLIILLDDYYSSSYRTMTSTPVQRNGAAASGDGGSGTDNHSVNLTDSTSTLITDAINKLDIHDGSG